MIGPEIPRAWTLEHPSGRRLPVTYSSQEAAVEAATELFIRGAEVGRGGRVIAWRVRPADEPPRPSIFHSNPTQENDR